MKKPNPARTMLAVQLRAAAVAKAGAPTTAHGVAALGLFDPDRALGALLEMPARRRLLKLGLLCALAARLAAHAAVPVRLHGRRA